MLNTIKRNQKKIVKSRLTGKKHILLLSTILLSALHYSSAQQITFQKTYGGTGVDDGFSVQQTTDGGYIIAGYTDSDSNDVYLIKTDAIGDTLWTRTFGGTGNDGADLVGQTSDGGYIVIGQYDYQGASYGSIYLIKTDSIGNTLWTKTFGGIYFDNGNSVQQTNDGGFIIAGETTSFGSGNYNVYLVKTDSIGNLLWSKTFGGTAIDWGYSVHQTLDTGYIITGITSSFGSGAYDVYLIKTDPNGNLLWSKTFGGTSNDYGKSVQQTTDGGYIITGETWSFGAGHADVYLIKTDSSGNLIWSKTFGGTNYEQGYSVQQTTDDGYIIAGDFSTSNILNAYLIKTDSTGNAVWTKIFGGANYAEGLSALQTIDGGYIITGEIHGFSFGSGDVYLIKTDSLGNSGCNQSNPATIVTIPPTIVTSPTTIVTTPATVVGSGGVVTTLCSTVGIRSAISNSQFEIFPNPFKNEITISLDNKIINSPTTLFLYDVYGKEILSQKLLSPNTELQTYNVQKGVYFIKVNSAVKKVVNVE